ncbi:carboxymuconolactone decarboxylase family protein [Novosphingobium sp. M1R2S20]|uniref:Carboxymuconolactone decarboxylase family protein n=1 Tax=Novosphingobium rhizovicinum TaxID=3228928 RepID=A0ABV3RB51_9SPHN
MMKQILQAVLGASAMMITPVQAQERPSVAPKNMQAIAPALADYTDDVLYGDIWERSELSPRDRSLVTISVLVATGKTAQLNGHLGRGLDNGIKPTELAGIVTHLAFYTGWPNAVSALNVVEQVFAERKIDARALRQPPSAPSSLPASATARAKSLEDQVAPTAAKLARLTDSVLFRDLWRRTDLAPRDRSLVTIAAMAANGDTGQLELHVERGVENGLTRPDMVEAFTHLAFYAGWPKAMAAVQVTAAPQASRGAAKSGVRILPPGQTRAAAPPSNFTGSAVVTSRFKGTGESRLGGGTVTFQPGAHTNWHVHPLGQLLIVTAGEGLVQAEGGPVRTIKAGDTVWIGPGVKHWHGAKPKRAMTHVAVSEVADGQSVTWLERLDEGQSGSP